MGRHGMYNDDFKKLSQISIYKYNSNIITSTQKCIYIVRYIKKFITSTQRSI